MVAQERNETLRKFAPIRQGCRRNFQKIFELAISDP